MKYFFLFFCFSVSAGTIETRELDITTETGDKSSAIEKAVQQVSRDFVKHLMGKEKYKKNRSLIERKIIKNKNRYILFVKTSAPKAREEGDYLTKVTLGVSEENLTALLLENNLFYSSAGASCILPAITFKTVRKQNRRKEALSWWENNEEKPPLLQNLSEVFYSALSEAFVPAGFYVMDPVFSRLSQSVPSSVLPAKNSARQFRKLTDFLNCDLILSGNLTVEKDLILPSYTGEFHLKVFNMKTLRELFSFKKRVIFPATEKDMKTGFLSGLSAVTNSLKYQLSFYRDRGALDLNRLFISIQGPLTYHQKERLRDLLVRDIPAIKDLRENLVTAGRVLYEMESSRNMKDLAGAVRSHKFPLFKVKVTGHTQKKMDIYAKTL